VGYPEMTVSAGIFSNVGTFSADISGLKYYTVYVYIPCATTATGEICGDPDLFMTASIVLTPTQTPAPTTPWPTPTPTPSVRVDPASGVTANSATFHGELTNMLGETSADAYFRYQRVPGGTVMTENAGTLLSTGPFSASVFGLSSRSTYMVQACVITTPTGYDVCGLPYVFATQ